MRYEWAWVASRMSRADEKKSSRSSISGYSLSRTCRDDVSKSIRRLIFENPCVSATGDGTRLGHERHVGITRSRRMREVYGTCMA